MCIDCESVYSSSSEVKQTSETLRKTINAVPFLSLLTSSTDVIIDSKWVALVRRKTAFGQSIWPAGDKLTTAFTILNCFEYEFLKGFLLQGRQQSFWKFSILTNILDFYSDVFQINEKIIQLSAMFTCRDGKAGGNSVARPRKCYINRLERFI